MSKTWEEKMKPANVPKTVKLQGEAAVKWGGETMYISCPEEMAEVMKKVPHGKIITTNEIRQFLAKKHKVDTTCPLTTGIFTTIVSNYAYESGKKIPYWRILKSGGELNPKYPGGVESHKKLLESEGIKVISRGKKFSVANYEEMLATLK